MKNFLSEFLSLYVYGELSIKLEELNCDQVKQVRLDWLFVITFKTSTVMVDILTSFLRFVRSSRMCCRSVGWILDHELCEITKYSLSLHFRSLKVS